MNKEQTFPKFFKRACLKPQFSIEIRKLLAIRPGIAGDAKESLVYSTGGLSDDDLPKTPGHIPAKGLT